VDTGDDDMPQKGEGEEPHSCHKTNLQLAEQDKGDMAGVAHDGDVLKQEVVEDSMDKGTLEGQQPPEVADLGLRCPESVETGRPQDRWEAKRRAGPYMGNMSSVWPEVGSFEDRRAAGSPLEEGSMNTAHKPVR
jgi:hypothetical protein